MFSAHVTYSKIVLKYFHDISKTAFFSFFLFLRIVLWCYSSGPIFIFTNFCRWFLTGIFSSAMNKKVQVSFGFIWAQQPTTCTLYPFALEEVSFSTGMCYIQTCCLCAICVLISVTAFTVAEFLPMLRRKLILKFEIIYLAGSFATSVNLDDKSKLRSHFCTNFKHRNFRVD